jgi:two-component system NtrC family sensor kinase
MPRNSISRRRLRVGLAVKLVVLLLVSTVALFALFGYLNLRLQRRHSEEIMLQSANRIGDLIARSTRYQMMRNDREALYQVISTIGAEPGIRRVRIFNEEGRITFSTDSAEINTSVDKGAEACYGCHARGEPLSKLERPDRARIFLDPHGQRVLGVIRPIENEPECSNAACHVHPSSRRILGVIDTHLSLAPVDTQVAAQEAELERFTAVAIVLFSVASALFIWTVVERPLKELMSGIHKVAAGDLGYRLPARSGDELGEVAKSFNRMTESLAHAQQEITAWGHTLEDRVEQKTRELEGAQQAILAREKMASLGKLAATVAHEVNNPLAGILTYASLTLKRLEKLPCEPGVRAEMSESLRTIERESRRCGDLMRNLLAFARQTPSQREPNDLNLLVEHGLALVHHGLELQGIALKVDLQQELPLLPCDAGQIRQVILALLVNAIEAMPNGGRLEVSTALDAGAQALQVRVRDNGVGIPSDVLPHIFEPFFTTKENQQGTGLGLAVARSILEQHGGEIAVNSTPGKGSEFTISLPLAAPVPVEAILASEEKR